MSASESIATPTRPTSPAARGSSESKPIWVGRSSATENPVCAGVEQRAEPLVGLSGRAEPGVLAHDPRLRLGRDAAGVRVLAGPLGTVRCVVRTQSLPHSCSPPAASWSRSTFLAILPVLFSGKASTRRSSLGFLYDASRARQWSMITCLVDLGPRGGRVERHDALAPVGVGHAEDRHLADTWHLGDDVLDLARVDVVPTRDDHVALAVDQPEVAVRAEPAEVAGVQPAVPHRLGQVLAAGRRSSSPASRGRRG